MRRVNLALMETVNAQRIAARAARPTLHPLAEFYGDWEREREARRMISEPGARSLTISLAGDDE